MIYKRGDVCWYRIKWTIKKADGTREAHEIRRSARTSNKRVAKTVEDEHRRALRLGEVHPLDPWPKVEKPAAPLFRVFASRFLEHAKAHTKPGTARFYSVALGRILNFSPVADTQITAITGELVSKYARHQVDVAELEIPTVNGDIRTIRRIMNLAEEWGLITRAPRIHELSGEKGRDRVITFAEEKAYLGAASGTVRDLAIIAADTGLRPDSELFPLEWRNVVLKGTPEAPHGLLRVPQGKTASAVRTVPLTARAHDVLKRREFSKTSRFVFSGPGKQGHIMTVQHAHATAIKNAELTPFPFYCWRHTFGTRCAESGMDRFTLARLMGHSSPRVAERYYVHVTESHVALGFGKFLDYQSRGIIEAHQQQTPVVQ